MFNPLTKLFRGVSNKQSVLCVGDLPDGHNQRATSSSSLFQTWKSGSQHNVKHWYKEALGMQASSCSGDSLSRPKVVSKMNRAFSEARSIMVLHYCGDADEQGDWVLPQGGGSITLNSICAVWEQQRKAHTRLLIVADCPNSFHWVAALAAMPKSDALRLNLCIQAAQATPDAHVSPGAFTLKWFSHHGGALSMQHRTAATMQQQDARAPGGAYHCTWGGESLHDFGVPLKFIAAHTSTDRVRGAGSTAPSDVAPVGGAAAATTAGTDSSPELLPEVIDQINMQGWGQQSASGKPRSQHVALLQAKMQGVLAMSAPQQPLLGGSTFSFVELSQSNHIPAARTQLEPSCVAHGQQGPPALAGQAASADPVLVVQTSRASVPSRCGALMDDFDMTDRTLSDSVQVEWGTNRRRSEAPTPNHNYNYNHGHRGMYLLQSKADAADLELNKEELGRRLDAEAGRRLRIGRRGALHGEEGDPTDPNNDDVLPSLDGSMLDLPLLNTRPDHSTSVTSALNSPVEAVTSLSPRSTPARAVQLGQAGAGGRVSSPPPHSSVLSGGHMSMDTTAPQPQFASGAPGPSRLARVTSAAHRVQDVEAAYSAAHPAPAMTSSPALLHGATRLATPRPSSYPQWELSSELLQLAPHQPNIPELGITSASSVALSQPTDFDFISFGSPAMPVSPQAAQNAGIQGIDIELLSFPQSPPNCCGQGRGAQLSPWAAGEPLPPMVGGSRLAGVSGNGGPGSQIKASASVCEMLRDLSGSVCSPSNQQPRYVLDANDSKDDREGSSHRDADSRRGRLRSLQGSETSSFFAEDERGILKDSVRKEPELVAEVERMQVKAPLPPKPMVSPFMVSQGPPSCSSSNKGASSPEDTCSTHLQQPQSAGSRVGSLGGRLSSSSVHPRIAAALACALSGMRSSSGRLPSNQLLQYVLHASDSTVDREGEGSEQRLQGRSGRRVALEGDEADGDLFADDAVRWALLQSLVKGDGELEEEVQLLQRNSMRRPPSASSVQSRQHALPLSQPQPSLPRGGSSFSNGGCVLAADGSSPSPSEAICLIHPKLVAGLADALAGMVQGPVCPSTKLVKHVQQASMMMFEEEEGVSSDGLAVAGGPCARRGRRLKLDGDEIASAVFGDDRDKWEAVKLIVRGEPRLEAEVEGLMNDQEMRWPEVQLLDEWAALTLVDEFPGKQVQSECAGVVDQEGVVLETGPHTAAATMSRGQGEGTGVGVGSGLVPPASAGHGNSWSLGDLGGGSRGTPHLGDPCTCAPTPGVGGARACWAERDGHEQEGPVAPVASVSSPRRGVTLTLSSSTRSSAEWPQEPPPPPYPNRAATTSCAPAKETGGAHGEQLHPSFLGTSIVTDLLASLPQDGWAAGRVGGTGAGDHGCPINTLDRLLMEQGRHQRQFDPSVKSITAAAASTAAAEGVPTTSIAAGPTSHS